jgi:small subunit ribosomal protein S21
MNKHIRFLARTVLVQDSNVDLALKNLNRILTNEKILETARRWERYEKPYQRRNRLSFEKCMSVYNSEMDRKIKFLVRKNRENPLPWV